MLKHRPHSLLPLVSRTGLLAVRRISIIHGNSNLESAAVRAASLFVGSKVVLVMKWHVTILLIVNARRSAPKLILKEPLIAWFLTQAFISCSTVDVGL